MSNRTADELLKWGLRNAPMNEDGTSSLTQVAADVAAGRRPDLTDPGLYDAIMGKSEAQMMQEELSVAVNAARTVEDRCTALDNFEMLVEQVDNANNMEPLGMWPPVLSLLEPHVASDERILVAAAWVVGTAVQNNDKAQAVALSKNALPRILTLLDDVSKEALCSKAVYALSAMLKHYPAAVQQFTSLHGWSKLQALLADVPSLGVRRKVAFLLNQLLLQARDAQEAKHTTGPVAAKELPAASLHLPAPVDETPATMRHDSDYPAVAQLLVDTGIVSTLLDSIVPQPVADASSATTTIHSAAICAGTLVCDDDDYMEKAVQVILTLLTVHPRPSPLPNDRLVELQQYLSRPAPEAPREATLGLDMRPLKAYLGA